MHVKFTHIHIKWDHESHQVFFGFDIYFSLKQNILWGKIWALNSQWLPRYCNLKFGQNGDPVFCRPDFELPQLFWFSTKLHEICQELQRTQSPVQLMRFYWINDIYKGRFWTVLPHFPSVNTEYSGPDFICVQHPTLIFLQKTKK